MDDWKKIKAINKSISEFMGQKPTIEYCVGPAGEDAYCLSPKNHDHWEANIPAWQKKVCEEWIAKHDKGRNEYELKKRYNYDRYDVDFGKLTFVSDKIRNLGFTFEIKLTPTKIVVSIVCGEHKLSVGKHKKLHDNLFYAIADFIKWYNTKNT